MSEQVTNDSSVIKKPANITALNYFYNNGQQTDSFYEQAVIKQKANSNRITGFSELDSCQNSMYPGLYVLGAVSSLGKTTFIHQICDSMASRGEHVLYFSLEQTEFELYSKSIARTLKIIRQNQTDPKFPSPSAIELRRGEYFNDQRVRDAIKSYSRSVENRMNIIPTLFSADVETIQNMTKEYMELSGEKPVVVVDYLQIVTPSVINKRQLEQRAAIDHIVHSLKCFQAEYDIVVILISSLNRQNYMTPIDFESFKESGGIEYTADVIWGLQLGIMSSNDIFNKEGHIKEKREAVQNAKAATPRKLELVCLKNRYGKCNYAVKFDYYPREDFFCTKLSQQQSVAAANSSTDKQ